jgi:hypothetical protein
MASVLYLAATVLFAQSTVAFNCSQPPIYVDIHNRTVHGTDKFQYGSFIGVGSPAQNQSLWPSISQNHTSFASSRFCEDNSTTLADCLTSTRGNFDFDVSSTFKEDRGIRSLDGNRQNGTFEGFLGRDNVHLYTHYFENDGASETRVTDTTIEIATSGSISPGILGMGQSSTILEALYAQGLIAGRTYSLYIGQGFERAGGMVNGSNTFGGFDAGRFQGDVHKYSMDLLKRNPMSLRIKDVVINDSPDSKQNISLFDPAAFPEMRTRPDSFAAEITTDQYPLSLPYQITQNFMAHLAAERQKEDKWGDDSLRLTKPFDGTLSIVLEDDFVVTLPAEVVANISSITPIQHREEDSDEPFYLGSAFLGQVYLMADYDSYQFYLAKARQKNAPVMPRTFCPKVTPKPYNPPKASKFVSQGLIGAVIGGVVGGLGIILFTSFFVISWMRNREARKQDAKFEKRLEEGKKASKMMQLEIDDKGSLEFDPPPKSATPFFMKKR